MSIRAYIIHDDEPMNPFEGTVATPLYEKPNVITPSGRKTYNHYEGLHGEQLQSFCDPRFNQEEFENTRYYSKESMCYHLKDFGCLAVPFSGSYAGDSYPDGILVMSRLDVYRSGHNDPSNARAELYERVHDYERLIKGETYGYVIVDDGDPYSEDDPMPVLVNEDELDYKELIDGCMGYYGLLSVSIAARDHADIIIRDRSRSMSKSKARKAKIKKPKMKIKWRSKR